MSSFTDPLIVRIEQRERNGRALFSLVDSFSYFVGHECSDKFIQIPAGFETDFASIPWFARGFISPVGRHAKAALIHDALYRGKAIINGRIGTRLSRRECDEIFLEAMEILGVPEHRRLIMFYSVRTFGGHAFRNNHSTVAEQNPTAEHQPSVAGQASARGASPRTGDGADAPTKEREL